MYNSNEFTLQMNRFNIENSIYYLHTPLRCVLHRVLTRIHISQPASQPARIHTKQRI